MSASPSGQYLYSIGTWIDAGNVRRQILRSHDLGESWCVLPTAEDVLHVAPSRASEQVIYALTSGRTGMPAHLLRTTDGGASWTAPAASLPETITDYEAPTNLLQTSVTDPNGVWVSRALTRIDLSSDGGDSWIVATLPPALIAPPYDPQTPPEQILLTHLGGTVVDPTSARRLLAWGTIGTIAASSSWPERWFTSDDAGQTWREISGPPLPADAPALDVLADVGGALYVSGGPTLLRSSNWGESWTSAGRLPDPLGRVTTLDARKPGRLFTWRTDAGDRGNVDATVRRSLDGGATWRPITVPADPAIDPVLSPEGSGIIVGVGGLRISVTINDGATWTPRSVVPRPGYLARSPVDGRRIWADNLMGDSLISTRGGSFPGLSSSDDGLTWSALGDFEGPLLMDGASADTAYTGLSDGSAGAKRTEDGGRTWTPFDVATNGIVAAAACPAPRSCLYLVRSRSSSTSNQLDCLLTRSDDGGRGWTEEMFVPSELCYAEPVVAVSPDRADSLAASCYLQEPGAPLATPAVCESPDGGKTWTPHALGTDPDRPVQSVVFLGGDVVLAATSTAMPLDDTQPSAVARSVDGGATWLVVSNEGGRLVASAAQPGTVFLISLRSNAATVISRSDDWGATWKVVSPDALSLGLPRFDVASITDVPGGGFIASTVYGLVGFR